MAVLGGSAVLGAAAPAASADPGAGSARLDGFERALIEEINDERGRRGLARVRSSRRLHRAADYHSREMIAGQYFSHESRNGWSFARRIRELAGLTRAGEVLAWVGYPARDRAAAQQVVEMWMASSHHRAQILTRAYAEVGAAGRFGPVGGGQRTVITVDLGRR